MMARAIGQSTYSRDELNKTARSTAARACKRTGARLGGWTWELQITNHGAGESTRMVVRFRTAAGDEGFETVLL